MATDEAYPFGTMLCYKNYLEEHTPVMYLGFIPYSYITIRDGLVHFVKGGEPVDVVLSVANRWDSTQESVPGWDERETIETKYHLWDPGTCGP
jgi:hypothetical protein